MKLQSWPKVFGTLQNYCMFLLFSSERVDLMKNKCLNQTPSPPPFNVDFGGILNWNFLNFQHWIGVWEGEGGVAFRIQGRKGWVSQRFCPGLSVYRKACKLQIFFKVMSHISVITPFTRLVDVTNCWPSFVFRNPLTCAIAGALTS
jgi:hypothetical protein